MRTQRNRGKLEIVQRRVLLRVIMVYRTVSAIAVQVIAGIPPIDLLVWEREALFESGIGHSHETLLQTSKTIIQKW